MGRRKAYTLTESLAFRTEFYKWVAKQSLPVEAAITTVTEAVKCAIVGYFADCTLNGVPSTFDPQSFPVPWGFQPLIHACLGGGPFVMARNFALVAGVHTCISCVTNRIKGKEDIKTEMVAGFTSGVVLSLANGMRGPNVISVGVIYAVANAGLFKILQAKEKSSQKYLARLHAEDVWYYKTRSMLSRLGLSRYEKNFKNGLLYDGTLPLLTESALQDAGIPIGPSLIILDHIKRELRGEETR